MRGSISSTSLCRIAAFVCIAAVVRADRQDSVALLRKEIAARPDDAALRVQLVELLLDSEHFNEAATEIQAGLLLNSQAAALHRVYGDLLFRQGRVGEAEAEYNAAIDSDHNNALAIYGSARVLRATGYRARAAGLVRAAHALAPDNEEIGRAFAAIEERHESELASPYQHYELPYRLLPEGRGSFGVGLPISVNGAKAELRLDTGAGGVTVSARFAAKAGIHSIGRATSWGIGSDSGVDTWLGYAEELRIGGLAFKNVIVSVAVHGSIDKSGGLIGAGLFKRFLLKIDFENRRVDLNPLFGPPWDGYAAVDRYEGPEMKPFAAMVQVRHYLLLPTAVSERERSDTTHALFLIDTGAGFNSISTDLARRVTTVRKNHHMSVKGVSGTVKMLYEADRILLRFAGSACPVPRLAAFDLSDISRSAGMEVGGILGMPALGAFRSITIDYRDEAILFEGPK
jgi:tetratricopeptide (TPR) repeat protein